MRQLLGLLLLSSAALAAGCSKSDAPAVNAAAGEAVAAAPAATNGATADAEPAKPAEEAKPAETNKPAEDKPVEEAQPTTDARPSLLLKLLLKPVSDAVGDATKALPMPQMPGAGGK